jgi:2-polyprenyl-3-methyl-5-hydroxy-6-metoxy-1,4-benzoquinol methylase
MTKSPAENQTFYNQYHKHENRGHANWLGKIKPITAGNFTYYFHLQLLQPFLTEIKNLTILDVGCGVGTLSLFLASRGAKKILGIDLASDAIVQAEAARQALKLKNLSFRSEKLTATTGKFDLIIASEIIEHVPDAKKFVTLLSANLKKGGSLILTTPYAHNFLRDHGYLKKHDVYAGHLKIFDEKKLLTLFPKTDWEIVQLQQTEGPLRMLLFITSLGKLIKLIRGPLVPLFHMIDEVFAKVFGKHDLQLVAKRR